jgi:TolA-binding protein
MSRLRDWPPGTTIAVWSLILGDKFFLRDAISRKLNFYLSKLGLILSAQKIQRTRKGKKVEKFCSLKVLLVVPTLFLSSCVMTRSDVKEVEQKKVVQDQVSTLQRSAADQAGRFGEINSDLREISGRTEVLENKINMLQRSQQEKSGGDNSRLSDQEKKLALMQEEMAKLEGQIVILNQEITSLKNRNEIKGDSEAASNKGLFEMAEDQFDKKEWKKSILTFQRFRDQNPKSKKFAKATLKIGQSFLELGLKDEAKTFFDEVITKYPDSAEAKLAARGKSKKR